MVTVLDKQRAKVTEVHYAVSPQSSKSEGNNYTKTALHYVYASTGSVFVRKIYICILSLSTNTV